MARRQKIKRGKRSYDELFSVTQEDSSFSFGLPQGEQHPGELDSKSISTCAKSNLSIAKECRKKEKEKERVIDKESIVKTFDVAYSLPAIHFRDKEAEEISSFIQDALKERIRCRCLLLTGTPGAGKTSLAKKMLRGIAGVKTIFMNANVSNSQFIMEFSYQLVGSKLRLPQLITYLEKRKAYEKAFVLLDEFDTLFANASVEFLDFFRIFSQPIQGVSLIATSNSMEMMRNLSERHSLSLPTYKNIVFAPYRIQQIKNIIVERVEEVKRNLGFEIEFQDLTLKYIATKIHNFKGGDIRFVLEQMRNIISKTLETNQSPKACKIIFESACVVLGKLNKSQEITDIMKSLPFQQTLALIAIYKLFEDNEYLEVTKQQVIKEIKSVQSLLKMTNQIFDIKDILMYLQVYEFVGIRYKKKDLYVTLKVSSEMVKSAFEDDTLFGKYFWK